MSGEREAGGQGWPTPCPGAARAAPAPGMGVAISCGSPALLWYLSASNIPEKIKIRFLEFFEKLHFRGIFRNWQMLKSRKPKVEKVEIQIKS
jgi:hypothetical protein